jgi:hypothetical protein
LVVASCGGSSDNEGDDGRAAGEVPDSLTIATSFAISDLLPLENGQCAPC